ncbi:hypothetical protein D9V32_07500 [Mycetocola tolaasinivorans]|uniref:Uncharacterized protein n=1 Tax=Mycetocola tolaasinivorans TaxID=76635 RepID=A0A3L7A789_9MICO|nr:hypothetical protein D9V32_07500 [Mycetocola tolaasinivorans]
MGTGVGATLALLLLAGCAVHEPDDNASLGPGPLPSNQTSASPGTETETPEDSTDAVLVLASVDVDGANVSLSGYVNGIIEDGGSCTYELTSEEGTIEKVERAGAADRSTTSCGVGQIPVEKLPSGTWTARLVYQPVDGSAKPVTSAPESVEVP